jgi:hypothetical protein
VQPPPRTGLAILADFSALCAWAAGCGLVASVLLGALVLLIA